MVGGTQAQFGDGMPDGRPGLWNLRFWRDGNPSNTVWLTNHDPSNRSAEISDGALRLRWEGLSLGDEAFVVDVMATVELTGDGASAEWRIYVRNSSERWGLAEVEYPIMRHVVASNTASGDFWTQGYRELMKPIREDAARRGVALTSESAAEPYLDSFDAFLTWTGHNPKDVPLLPAVYSGYALYFGSCQFGSDSLESYCALQARAFLWGCQLGWNQTRLASPSMEKHAEFTRKLCRARLDNLDFFLYGELLGEVVPVGEVPMVDVKWNRDKVGEFKVPAVFGTVWRNDGGERRAFIVNITGEELRFVGGLGEGGSLIDMTIPPRSAVACRQ